MLQNYRKTSDWAQIEVTIGFPIEFCVIEVLANFFWVGDRYTIYGLSVTRPLRRCARRLHVPIRKLT